jgi:inactive STAND
MNPESNLLEDGRAIRRLESMIERTQSIADALHESIPIETNVETRAKLEIRLRKKETELASLLQRRADIISMGSRERLRSALIRLDFENQMRCYRRLTEKKNVGAFVVLPEPPKQAEHIEIAAGLLFERLLQALPGHLSTTPIRMSFKRRVRKSDNDALWRELARVVGLHSQAKQQDVIDQVVERLKTQHVVILLTDLDRVDFDDCIDQFWKPLASAVTDAKAAHSLVLVLVDWNGEAQAQVSTEDIPAPLWIGSLSEDDISLWFQALADDCPLELLEAPDAAAREIIAAASERNPDGVLEEIVSRSEWKCPEFYLEEWFAI